MSPAELRRLSHGNPSELIDRRKPSFKKLGLGDRELTDDEAIELMQQEPSIIRRPILEIDGDIVIGYNEADLTQRFG